MRFSAEVAPIWYFYASQTTVSCIKNIYMSEILQSPVHSIKAPHRNTMHRSRAVVDEWSYKVECNIGACQHVSMSTCQLFNLLDRPVVILIAHCNYPRCAAHLSYTIHHKANPKFPVGDNFHYQLLVAAHLILRHLNSNCTPLLQIVQSEMILGRTACTSIELKQDSSDDLSLCAQCLCRWMAMWLRSETWTYEMIDHCQKYHFVTYLNLWAHFQISLNDFLSLMMMKMRFPVPAVVLLLSSKWEQFPVYLPRAYHNITVGGHFADIWSVWRSLCGHNHPVMTHSYRNCPLWGRFRERIASGWDSISFCCLPPRPHWKAKTPENIARARKYPNIISNFMPFFSSQCYWWLCPWS